MWVNVGTLRKRRVNAMVLSHFSIRTSTLCPVGTSNANPMSQQTVDVDFDNVVVRVGAGASTAFGSVEASLLGRPFESLFQRRDHAHVGYLLGGKRESITAGVRRAHAQTRTVALQRVECDTVHRFFVIDVSGLGGRALDHDRFFQISHDLVCTAGLDGFFERVSPSFTDLLGYTEEELLTRPIMDFLHPDDREKTSAQFDRLAEMELGDPQFFNRYFDCNKREVWLQWASRLDRETGLVYAIARDITKQKDLERKLVAAREEAEKANTAKSSFLASMSHELRTPLNAIIGYSEMLIDEFEDDGLRADLQHVCDAGHQLLQLINGILDLSKIEAGRLDVYFEAVQLEELIEGVVATVSPMVKRNGNTFSLDVTATGRLLSDRRKLHQVLLNLLSNAAKFTQDGEVTLRVHKAGADVRFIVEDSGVGMSESELKRMFVPFAQGTKDAHGNFLGTGLGVPIAVRFAEALGIRFEVESTPGQGTKFTLTVPRAPVLGPEAEQVTGGYLVVRDETGNDR